MAKGRICEQEKTLAYLSLQSCNVVQY